MANEYATRDELKTHTSIADALDDDNLDIALEAASRHIDALCGRRFYADSVATARTYTPANDLYSVFTDDFYTTSGLVVVNNGTTLVNGTDFELTQYSTYRPYEGLVSFNALYKDKKRKTVSVTAKWGWTAVPVEIKDATLILATKLFKRKDAPQGIVGFGDMGGMRLSANDPDVTNLIAPYRKIQVGL